MEESELRSELTPGKPLFSLQVDDILVQQIFQKLAEQIKRQNEDIEILKKELANRPKMTDFITLSEAVVTLQKQQNDSSSILSQTVDQFKSSLDEKSDDINKLVQNKLNEMLFSVNAAIRGQMEMLDQSPMNTTETVNAISDIKLTMGRLRKKITDLKDTVIQIAAAHDGNLKVDNLTRKTAPSCVRVSAKKDRDDIFAATGEVARMKKKFEEFVNTFERVIPYTNDDFPQFINNYLYQRTETPSFPKPPEIHSLDDFIQYQTVVVPMMQAMIREIHSYVRQIEATVNNKIDRHEFDLFVNDMHKTLGSMIVEVDDYSKRKHMFVLQHDFDELSDNLYKIVNGASNSSCTNTRCIACGKTVQRTTGTIKVTKDTSRSERPLSARGTDLLRVDGLSSDSPLEVRRVMTARSAFARPRTPVNK